MFWKNSTCKLSRQRYQTHTHTKKGNLNEHDSIGKWNYFNIIKAEFQVENVVKH